MKGLLFRPELANKIKTGHKTQTRRPLPCNVKEGEILFVREATWVYGTWGIFGSTKAGKPKFRFVPEQGVAVRYTDEEKPTRIATRIAKRKEGETGYTLRSPLHCRAKDARLFLKVTGRKDEPLQDITVLGAQIEGIAISVGEHPSGQIGITYMNYLTGKYEFAGDGFTPQDSFRTLWNSINGTDLFKCWAANPTVAVITFEVTENPFKK